MYEPGAISMPEPVRGSIELLHQIQKANLAYLACSEGLIRALLVTEKPKLHEFESRGGGTGTLEGLFAEVA